jgi:hypothetical protein
MAIPLVVNGVTFQYPQQFDKNWGPTLTGWSSAVTSGMLQKAGGAFTLTAEVDFGSSFGIKVKSIKSEEASIAHSGFLRLANASAGIVWRNALDGADLPLTVNASNQLTFNGVNVGATTSLTDSHILVGNASNQPADVAMSGDITITNAGVTALGAGKVLNANINASAAIALSKLASTSAYYWYTANAAGVLTPQAVTPAMAVITDANGLPTASTVTATELGYVHSVTSAIQTQIDSKVAKAGDTMSGVLNMASHKITSLATGSSASDAVAYSQLKLLQTVVGTLVGSATTTSTTFVSTGLSVNITPTSASSRILIMASGTFQTVGNNGRLTIYRDSGNVAAANGIVRQQDHIQASASLSIIDSPATTSAVSYAVFFLSENGASTVQFGDTNLTASIIAMEIV